MSPGIQARTPAGPAPRTAAPAVAPLRWMPKLGGRFTAGPVTATVTVKFREGTDARVAAGRLELASGFGTSAAAPLIASACAPGGVSPTFDLPAETLRAKTAALERSARADLADLSLYVDVETSSPGAALRLAGALDALDEVEVAYARPEMPAPTARGPRPAAPAKRPASRTATPPLDQFQYYLSDAPFGLGVRALRERLGEDAGRGRGVRVVDVEYSWFLEHEDLPFDAERPGYREIYPNLARTPGADLKGQHGAANLGLLVGGDNGYGITGICPDAGVGLVNPKNGTAGKYRLAAAIRDAADALEEGSGDIILIEQQVPGPHTVDAKAAPAEWLPDIWDAVRQATAKGLVVVEAASNGPSNLDSKLFQGAFSRSDSRDSGAIIVGAGQPPVDGLINASRVADSSYGSRVDMQGQGEYVATLGNGDLYKASGKKPPRSTRYTMRYGGTSAAATQVAAVAAVVQGAVKDAGMPPLRSELMRTLLAGTGTPDNSSVTTPIGPRPDADAAVRAALAVGAPWILGVRFDEGAGQFVVDGLYFAVEGSAVEVQVDGEDEPLRFETVSHPGPLAGWPDEGFASRVQTTAPDVRDRVPTGRLLAVTVVVPDGAEPAGELRSQQRYVERRPPAP